MSAGGAKTVITVTPLRPRAYQTGVLRAIAEMSHHRTLPFRIVSGISAGAINTAFLASRADDFSAVKALRDNSGLRAACAGAGPTVSGAAHRPGLPAPQGAARHN